MIALLAAALAAALSSQPPATFATGVESVYVDVFVTDRGIPVTGLTAADFELKDDGVRREVELAGTEETAIATLLVLDTSGSVDGEKLTHLRAGVGAVMKALPVHDEVGLLTFSEELRVRVRPGRDAVAVVAAMDAARAGGATALYDAVYAGLALSSGRGRSLLVVFTDGEDNLSWLDGADVARAVAVSNVLLQVVGTASGGSGELVFEASGSWIPGFRRSPAPEQPHVAFLRRLAESTGGHFWGAGDPGGIARAFEAMVAAMKTRYVLRFDPGRPRRPGRHDIEVRLKGGRRGKVHSRRAYFAAPETGP